MMPATEMKAPEVSDAAGTGANARQPEIYSVEVFDPGSGLYVSLTAGGNGAVMLGTEVIAASPIPEGGLASFGPETPLALETERGELEINLDPVGEPIQLTGVLVGSRQAVRAKARGHLDDREERIEIDGHGVIHSATVAPSSRALRRDLTVMLDDGGLLCVSAAGPDDSWCHGEEEAVAAISHPGGYLDFEQVLISTESDAAGRQMRGTLELWPASEDLSPLHGAGRSLAGCTARLEAAEVNTALFRWSLDSHRGTGRYELTRPLPQDRSGR